MKTVGRFLAACNLWMEWEVSVASERTNFHALRLGGL